MPNRRPRNEGPGPEEQAEANTEAEPEGPQGWLKGWPYRRLDGEAEMTSEQAARIAALGRERGAELSHTVAGKTAALRTLGWPEALREAQKARAA
jgi:hypothetical protein